MDDRQGWTHRQVPWISSGNARGKLEAGFLFKSPCEETQASDIQVKFQFPSTGLPVQFLGFPASQAGCSLCPIPISSVPPGEFHDPPGRNFHSSGQGRYTLSSPLHVAGWTEDHQKYGENSLNGNDGFQRCAILKRTQSTFF
jgi:hypothetical protein